MPAEIPPEITVDFLRHGIAVERDLYQEDAHRPLTSEGRQRTEAVIRRLKSLGWSWQVALTSPLLRAQQTAQIAQQVGVVDQILEFPALAPGGEFSDLVHWHQDHPQIYSLGLVGHQPDLSQWIERCLWGQAWGATEQGPEVIRLKKAGIARVEFPGGQIKPRSGVLCALLRPKLLLKSRQPDLDMSR